MRPSGREEAGLAATLEAEEGAAEDEDGEDEMIAVIEGEIEMSTFETGIETREAENVTGSETETGATRETLGCADRQSGELDRQRGMGEIFGIVIGIYLQGWMQTDLDVAPVMVALLRQALQHQSPRLACCHFLEEVDSVGEEEVEEEIGAWKEVVAEFRTTIAATATCAAALRKGAGLVSVTSASGTIGILMLMCVVTFTSIGTGETFSAPRWQPRSLPRRPKTSHLFM